jgi:flagellar basal body-associated protein FliL
MSVPTTVEIISLLVSIATLLGMAIAAALFFFRFGKSQEKSANNDQRHDHEVARLNDELKSLSSIVKDLLLVQTRQAIAVDNHSTQLKDIEQRLRSLEAAT